MSPVSAFTPRWQRLRSLPGRIPLRIKLITAVLALVAIALSIISIAGISVLRGYLLSGYDASLENPGAYHDVVQHYLFNPTTTESFGGQQWLAFLPASGRLQPVLVPVEGRPGFQPTALPRPAMPATASWLAAHDGQPVTVGAQSGGRRWRVIAYDQTFFNPAGGTISGTVLAGLDVTSVYRTVDALAHIDMVVSSIVLLALAIVGVAIVRSSLRPLTDIEVTAQAIAAGDPSYRTIKGILAAGTERDDVPLAAGDGGAAAFLHGPASFANVVPMRPAGAVTSDMPPLWDGGASAAGQASGGEGTS